MGKQSKEKKRVNRALKAIREIDKYTSVFYNDTRMRYINTLALEGMRRGKNPKEWKENPNFPPCG